MLMKIKTTCASTARRRLQKPGILWIRRQKKGLRFNAIAANAKPVEN
jgi:hypothetical protein